MAALRNDSLVGRLHARAIVALTCGMVLACTSKPNAVERHARSADPSAVSVGDVIFFRTITWRGRLVRALETGQGDFAHVGIIVSTDDDVYVVHASPSPSVVTINKLDDLLARDEITSAVIYRPRVRAAEAVRAASVAAEYASRKTPFDFRFNLADDHQIYCTELIWLSYRAVGLKIEGSGGILFPDDLVQSGFFRPLAIRNPAQ